MPQPDADSLFHCQMCGHCCEGRGGIVVSPTDLKRLAAFLGLAPETVVERYGEISGGKLKVRNGEDGRCIFFREGAGCSVHEGKPSICRAWPFFRGNIEDPVSLELAKEFCPGIAPDAAHEEFAAAGRAYLAEQGLVASDPACEANALVLP
ncbi:MAG: YkgJ family cysteine cluster protein [Desulfovibrio sp.]|nr:YkgJ family cysteine cluster protein [Desulfovibrio sp.]